MLDAVQATLRTNFYNADRYALSLRIRPELMMGLPIGPPAAAAAAAAATTPVDSETAGNRYLADIRPKHAEGHAFVSLKNNNHHSFTS